MRKKAAKPISPEDILRSAGIAFDRLEDVPAKVIREAMRHVTMLNNFRSIELPSSIIVASRKEPLLRDLLVTRAGYSGPTIGHYIPRPEGSLDHILIHCVRGAGWLEMAGHRWEVGPETAFCVPAGVPHAYGAEKKDPWSIYWLHLTGAQIPALFQFLCVSQDNPLIYLPHNPQVLSAFEAVYAAMKAVHTRENLMEASLRASCYVALMHHLRRARDPRGRASEEAIRQSIDFMTNNLGASVSLTELAELADMSIARYTAAFRKVTTCSPVEYFNRLKIQKACELLRFSTKGVKEIGQELGYEDPYYFSHAFKKFTGVSPATFRKR